MEQTTDTIIKNIRRRTEQLDKTTIQIIETHKDHKTNIENQNIIFSSKMDLMKKDLDEVRELLHTLTKSIRAMGRELKSFVSTDELAAIAERIESRDYGDYITRSELNSTFDFYAKK